MSKLTLSDIVNLENPSAVSTISSNSRAIEAAFNNTLSRDGTSPNEMHADLDMNSRRVINLPVATSATEPVRKNEFDVAVFAVIHGVSATTQTIGTGTKVFVVPDGLAFQAGQYVAVIDSVTPTNYMSGRVVSYLATNLTVAVTALGGSGTKSLWDIYLSGVPGPASSPLPLFTIGSVPFSDLNGFLVEDNTNLYWDNVNKRLGVKDLLATGNIYPKGGGAIREVLTANRIYYVRTDGSDSNTGLANTAGGAFATIQKAYNTALTIDLNGYTVTAKLGNTGTFTTAFSATAALVGGNFIIEGDTGTPTNTHLNVSTGSAVTWNCPGLLTVQYLKISSTNVGVLSNGSGSKVYLGSGVVFGANTSYAFRALSGGYINAGSFTLSGNCAVGFEAALDGVVEMAANTITLSGSPVFSTALVSAQLSGSVSAYATTFSGSTGASSVRFSVALNGAINTYGGGLNYFAGTNPGVFASGGQYDGAIGSYMRELLTANRTYYVGYNIGALSSITIATPAVVNKTAHGLQVADPVVFQVPPNTSSCTISTANPAVVTMANSFAAGQPVTFSSTGYLPTGITKGVTYYVIATGLSGSSFQISTTPGGAAVNTTALTNTFVNGNSTVTTSANHNLVVGQIIQFAGTSVVNVANATNYWVLSTPAGNTLTFSATATGAAVVPGAVTTQGTFVQNGNHLCHTTGALPTGITEGTVYYVSATGFGANSFSISDTAAHANAGTNNIATSGSVTGTPVYTAYTGNDTNSGLSQTRGGALLTAARAWAIISGTLDFGGAAVIVQFCDGTFSDTGVNGISLTGPWTGGGQLNWRGNSSIPDNVYLSPNNAGGSAIAVSSNLPGPLYVQWMKIGGSALSYGIQFSGKGIFYVQNCSFTAVASVNIAAASFGASLYIIGTMSVYGGASVHTQAVNGGYFYPAGAAVSVYNVPAFFYFAYSDTLSIYYSYTAAYSGAATGYKYISLNNAAINTGGAGANVFPGSAAGYTTAGGLYI